MTDLPLHPYTQQLLLNQAAEIERRLALIGITPEELANRAYVVNEDNGSQVYYFDGKPIIRSHIEYEKFMVSAIVESL